MLTLKQQLGILLKNLSNNLENTVLGLIGIKYFYVQLTNLLMPNSISSLTKTQLLFRKTVIARPQSGRGNPVKNVKIFLDCFVPYGCSQ